jgi:Meiotically Up-regulated Gene 113 (MUG113) protein
LPEFKTLPDLVRIGGVWTVEPFKPTRPAFTYEDFVGKTGTLYVVGCGDAHHKIGMSTNFSRRFEMLSSGTPFELKRVATRTVPLAGLAYAEAWMLAQFADRRIKGEWFAITAREALEKLPAAIRRAKVYTARCAEWWREDRRQCREDPKRRAKLDREYAQFQERSAPKIDALMSDLHSAPSPDSLKKV